MLSSKRSLKIVLLSPTVRLEFENVMKTFILNMGEMKNDLAAELNEGPNIALCTENAKIKIWRFVYVAWIT